jgi:guanylate kinase
MDTTSRKLLVFTAPSGAGKTTIVRHLLNQFDELAFSISATNRPRRDHEVEGKDYYFLSTDRFRELIEEDAFLEWEEVYEDRFYGTLKSEVERIWAEGKYIIFDIDVKGAVNLKQQFGEQALTVFVKPPSMPELFRRLQNRKTESADSLHKRMSKAAEELQYENKFDRTLVNDVLENALSKAEELVRTFLL